jgi:phenylacetate-coenzyme A ligase PaaK-like adenylate-forming protein
MNLESLIDKGPYSLNENDKTNILNEYFYNLTKHHYNNCKYYQRILNSIEYDINIKQNYSEIPFLPVRLFKMFDMMSVPKDKIVKMMTSSGTSGQEVSKIFLDKKTAFDQSKVLVKIISSFIGSKRSPMIIIDTPSVTKNRKMFSARGAGILGFSIFGSKKIYALNDDMELNIDELNKFLSENENSRIFIFGFTYMIYKHFLMKLEELDMKINISNGIMIHGGGWKKLEKQSINSNEFRNIIYDYTGIKSVHDYYGMVEQTGSIFMECENGNLHAPIHSDIIIRRSNDFSIAEIGERGIIQTLSILPLSYPGHSLITEDEGVLLGQDDCSCGRYGKYFKIFGRLKNAEIRGCSDTYES